MRVLLNLAEKLVDGYFACIPRKKPLHETATEAKIIAHRGAHRNSHGIIENTLAAFDMALQTGCWGIELDIHATKDNMLVVNHDPDLKRLWKHAKDIAALTWAELHILVPQIPTLDDIISKYAGRMHLFIELKAPFLNEDALVQSLHALEPGKDYHLLTLNAEVLNNLKHIPKSAILLVASHNNVKHFCDLSISNEYGGVLGNYLLLTRQYIQQLHNAKQVCGVGFINSKNSLFRELNRQIKWIFTNQAVKISRYLQNV